jgi:CRISPR/Cas system Type II protein with McrA/HNH and RuvC-like nuclease domain
MRPGSMSPGAAAFWSEWLGDDCDPLREGLSDKLQASAIKVDSMKRIKMARELIDCLENINRYLPKKCLFKSFV